jgi:hypothetical protein
VHEAEAVDGGDARCRSHAGRDRLGQDDVSSRLLADGRDLEVRLHEARHPRVDRRAEALEHRPDDDRERDRHHQRRGRERAALHVQGQVQHGERPERAEPARGAREQRQRSPHHPWCEQSEADDPREVDGGSELRGSPCATRPRDEPERNDGSPPCRDHGHEAGRLASRNPCGEKSHEHAEHDREADGAPADCLDVRRADVKEERGAHALARRAEHEPGHEHAEGNAGDPPGGAEDDRLDEQETHAVAATHPDGAKERDLSPTLRDRHRHGVEDEEHGNDHGERGEEPEDDADGARGERDLAATSARQLDADAGPDGGAQRGQQRIDAGAGRGHHVDLVQAALLGERDLGGLVVHHREVAAERDGGSLGSEQAADDEDPPSSRCRELDAIVAVEAVAVGVRPREDDRIRLAQEHERIVDHFFRTGIGAVAPHVVLLGDVHPEDGEDLARRPDGVCGRLQERRGGRDARHAADGVEQRFRDPGLPAVEAERGVAGECLEALLHPSRDGPSHHLHGDHRAHRDHDRRDHAQALGRRLAEATQADQADEPQHVPILDVIDDGGL